MVNRYTLAVRFTKYDNFTSPVNHIICNASLQVCNISKRHITQQHIFPPIICFMFSNRNMHTNFKHLLFNHDLIVCIV